MTIILKKLSGLNFKGLRSFCFEFDPESTDFKGYNKTGKTTLMDAFLWLFFGKDSTDRKDFEIKTLDENNKPYHRLDHEVSAVITVDMEEITLRRVFKEKWTKPRGTNQEIFSGHTTDFYWNEVPMKESEYQAKVSSIINENIFKLITNTSYFNSLKWQDRRNALIQIAGTISNDDVISSLSGDFTELKKALNAKKTVDEFKKEIGSKKKTIKEGLEQIPFRIDEADRSMPELVNYAEIETKISEENNDLATIEQQLMDKTESEKKRQQAITDKVREVGTMKSRLQQIEFEEKNKVQEKRRHREQVILNKKVELRNKQDEKSRLLVDYSTEEKRRSGLELIADDLRKKWDAVNKEQLVFKDDEFKCPACGTEFAAEKIETKKTELTNNFNANKSKRLEEITAHGKKVKEDIEVINAKLGNIKSHGITLASEIELLQNDIATLEQENARLATDETTELNAAIEGNTEYAGISQMIKLRNEEIESPAPAEDRSDLISRKQALRMVIDDLKKQLATKEQREKVLARIEELKQQESKMAQELANLEGVEFSIEQFTKAKMDLLENRINGRFKVAKFKMFEDQINGGQVEACTTLINGVPYSDANYASRIQAGLDIINVFCDHYNVYAPVWIDNRESVIDLPQTNSQLINLFVSESHQKLTLVRKKELVAA
jgi:exonuclease SbcC